MKMIKKITFLSLLALMFASCASTKSTAAERQAKLNAEHGTAAEVPAVDAR